MTDEGFGKEHWVLNMHIVVSSAVHHQQAEMMIWNDSETQKKV